MEKMILNKKQNKNRVKYLNIKRKRIRIYNIFISTPKINIKQKFVIINRLP